MEVRELYELSVWFDKHISQAGLIDRIARSAIVMQSNNNETFSLYKTYGDQLIVPFSRVPIQELTKEQQNILRRLDVIALLGTNASSYFSNAFAESHSYKEISNIIAYGRSSLLEAKELLDPMLSTLPELVDVEEEKAETPIGYASLRLTFQDDAAISDMSKFELWAKKWHLIGRGFALATNKKTQDIKIIGAGNGSIFLDILGNLETINLIGEATNHLLDIGLKIAEAYGLYAGVKELKERMPTKEAKEAAEPMVQAAKKEFEDKKSTLYTEAAEQILSQHNTPKEHVAALARALRELDGYIKLGGDISYLSIGCEPDSESDDDIETTKINLLDLQQQKLSQGIKKLKDNKSLILLEDRNDLDHVE